MDLLEQERETYETMWAMPEYADYAPGERFAPLFRDMTGLETLEDQSVLDAGCGTGKGGLALQRFGMRVFLCDLTDSGLVDEARILPFRHAVLWNPLSSVHYQFGSRYDWVYCTDVLEHIAPQFTMLVVSRLLEVARHGVFLSVSFMPDQFGVWAGKSLHQSMQSFVQWRDQFRALTMVRECRDLLSHGVYLLEPR